MNFEKWRRIMRRKVTTRNIPYLLRNRWPNHMQHWKEIVLSWRRWLWIWERGRNACQLSEETQILMLNTDIDVECSTMIFVILYWCHDTQPLFLCWAKTCGRASFKHFSANLYFIGTNACCYTSSISRNVR